MVCPVSATSRQHSGSEISGQARSQPGQAPPAGPAQRSAAPPPFFVFIQFMQVVLSSVLC